MADLANIAGPIGLALLFGPGADAPPPAEPIDAQLIETSLADQPLTGTTICGGATLEITKRRPSPSPALF